MHLEEALTKQIAYQFQVVGQFLITDASEMGMSYIELYWVKNGVVDLEYASCSGETVLMALWYPQPTKSFVDGDTIGLFGGFDYNYGYCTLRDDYDGRVIDTVGLGTP